MQEYLLAAPVASFILVLTIATSLYAFSNEVLLNKLMLQPCEVYHGKRVYTIITSGLIHKDWGHLFFNMLTYYFFAFQLEVIIGHWQFGLLYTLSLILSDMPSVYKHKDDIWYRSLGASGAISAVLFGYILFFPLTSLYIFFAIPVKAIIFAVLYLVYCAYASRQSRDAINHDAHFFGAISGVMITILLRHDAIAIFLQQLGL